MAWTLHDVIATLFIVTRNISTEENTVPQYKLKHIISRLFTGDHFYTVYSKNT